MSPTSSTAPARPHSAIGTGIAPAPGDHRMLKSMIGAAIVTSLASTVPALAGERIRLSSDRGDVVAELADNAATRRLVQMLPLSIPMRDHLRQEKTGRLPEFCPQPTGNWTSRPGRWAFGAPATSSSTPGAGASHHPASSSSAASPAMSPSSISWVRSPFAWSAFSEGRAMDICGAPKVMARPSPMQRAHPE